MILPRGVYCSIGLWGWGEYMGWEGEKGEWRIRRRRRSEREIERQTETDT